MCAAVVAAFVVYWFIIWYCPYCKRALPIATGDYCPFCGKRIHYSDNDDADSNQQQNSISKTEVKIHLGFFIISVRFSST